MFCADVMAADLKQILIAAIDTPSGQAEGILDGGMADYFKVQTRSSEPVRVKVKTLSRFPTAGCARLEATLLQERVPTQQGGFAPFAIRYEINLCRDGHPPSDGIDMEAMSRMLVR
jgi:hypothetical protein